jgi:hypothetical protein
MDTAANLALVTRHAPAVLRAAGLPGHEVTDVTRIPAASKKGVYRLRCAGDFSVILYVWSATEDYWPAAEDDPAGVFVARDRSGAVRGVRPRTARGRSAVRILPISWLYRRRAPCARALRASRPCTAGRAPRGQTPGPGGADPGGH